MRHTAFTHVLYLPCPLGQIVGVEADDWDCGRTLGDLVRAVRAASLNIGTVSIQRARLVVTVDREPSAVELRSFMVALRRPEDEATVSRRTAAMAVPTGEELAE